MKNLKFTIPISLFLLSCFIMTKPWVTEKTQNESTPRHECALTEANGKFYLMGGRGIKPVEEYNPKTKSWRKLNPTPLEMHHFQALNYQGKIYIIGAFTGKYPGETPIENIYIFDPKKDHWEKGPLIPENRRRGAAGLVVYQKKFYLVGGIVNGHIDQYVNWLDEWNPKTGEWKVLPDAPHPRDHVQAAVAKGKLVLAGGRTSSQATKQVFQLTVPEVDVYDFEMGKWETMPENLNIPTQRAGVTAISYQGKVIILGGESGTQKSGHAEVEAFDVEGQTWDKLPQLNQGRHGTQAILYKKKLYIGAGSGNRGGGPELSALEYLELD